MWNVACLRVPYPLSAGMLRVSAYQARWLHRVVTWTNPAPDHVHWGHSRWGRLGPAPSLSLALSRGRGMGGAGQGPGVRLGSDLGAGHLRASLCPVKEKPISPVGSRLNLLF